MNRKIEPFKIFKRHRRIVLVESSVIEISESVHWSRRCYAICFTSVWNEIVLGSHRTVNQTTSCQHTHSKKFQCSTLEKYDRVRIEIKHMYPCFIAEINYGYSWFNSYAFELVPIFYYRDKTTGSTVLFLY